MPQCSTCGSEVREEARFCHECGAALQSSSRGGDLPLLEDWALPGTRDAPSRETASPLAPGSAEPLPGAGGLPPPAAPEPAPAAGAEPGLAAANTARLTLKRGGVLTAESFEMGGRVTLGRFDPTAGPVDIDLSRLPEATYVSRRHAEMWRDAAGHWFIRDLGSRNGTFRRAAREEHFHRVTDDEAVTDGDEIGLGNAHFEFRLG